MTGRPVIGLMIALIIEGAHWTRIRWDFDEAACSRAWHLSSVAIALAAVLIWLDGNRYSALLIMLSWLPALIIPMQFVQSYGMRDSLPLRAFSFLAKQHRARSRRFGLIQENTSFNFGNVMFAVTILATTVGIKVTSHLFLPGLLILSGWMLMSAAKARLLMLLPVLVLAGLMALVGRLALEKADDWIGGSGGKRGSNFNPNLVSTMIGKSGSVVQSEEIVWRLKASGQAPGPRLLRTASFNNYLGSNWRNQRLGRVDFQDLDSILVNNITYYLLKENESSRDVTRFPNFTLRGTATAETPLPLPGDAKMLSGFALEGVERNSFGTVRVFPKDPVIEGTVLWRGDSNPEFPPIVLEDLQIPISEREIIHHTMEQIGIRPDASLSDKLTRLRTFFHQRFQYTRDLTISQPYSINGKTTAIGRFLTEVRAGHCEYFATAATLILRASGTPTRYATGYAVIERDVKRGGFLLRGTHGHSWCRVWDQNSGLWIDFDPTPPDWIGSVIAEPRLAQRLNDDLKRLREDFFLWRNRPENRVKVTLIMLTVGILSAVFILRRLWRSRQRLLVASPATAYDGVTIQTPLHSLERPARKQLGERPTGETFAHWLMRLRPVISDHQVLEEAITLHQRLRFDPTSAHEQDFQRLLLLVTDLKDQLQKISTAHSSH